MLSKEEIRDAFELMKILSPKGRKRFHSIEDSQCEAEQDKSYHFIRADGNSYQLSSENEDAKLERDS